MRDIIDVILNEVIFIVSKITYYYLIIILKYYIYKFIWKVKYIYKLFKYLYNANEIWDIDNKMRIDIFLEFKK